MRLLCFALLGMVLAGCAGPRRHAAVFSKGPVTLQAFIYRGAGKTHFSMSVTDQSPGKYRYVMRQVEVVESAGADGSRVYRDKSGALICSIGDGKMRVAGEPLKVIRRFEGSLPAAIKLWE